MLLLKNKEIKPKIGFIGSDRQNILEDLNFTIENGFDYYEIQGLGEKFDFKPEVIREAKKISENNNISLNLHALQFLPISSLIPEISEAAFKFAKREIVLANKIGVKRITIHSGHKEMPRREIAVAKNFKILIKNLKEIVEFGKKYRIKIGLENSPANSTGVCVEAEDLLNVVNSVKELGVVFDIGHANTTNLKPVNYFKKVKDFIINIHIHDNDGTADQHALIGKGNINFREFLQECKNSHYYGPFILEIFPKEMALKGKEIFLNLWNQL